MVFDRCSFASKFINKSKFQEMDKIFKNDTIMGLVALATLALVAWSFYENHKPQKELGN
jgi:hypothetical protein